MIPKIFHESWHPLLGNIFEKEELRFINTILLKYCLPGYNPNPADIFTVFQMPVDLIKVMILGESPYYDNDLSNGLAYGISDPSRTTKFLDVIEDEIATNNYCDESYTIADTTLVNWWKQGVFLLNTSLTTPKGEATAHMVYWKPCIEHILKQLLMTRTNIVFMSWGKNSKTIIDNIDASDKGHAFIYCDSPQDEVRLRLQSTHSSFWKSRCFNEANRHLTLFNKDTINW